MPYNTVTINFEKTEDKTNTINNLNQK
jgi:hypothetical protein